MGVRNYLALSWRPLFHGVAGLSFLVFFKNAFADVQYVTGPSMSPSLSPDWDSARHEDLVLISKMRYGRRVQNDGADDNLARMSERERRMRARAMWAWNVQDLRRGDIVTFWSPLSNQLALKRVIALAGDRIVTEGRSRHGRGYQLSPAPSERDVLDEQEREGARATLVIPYGHVWVEGDNPYMSQDSRDFGPISQSLVTGKVMAVVWPPSRIGYLTPERPRHWMNTIVKPGRTTLPAEFGN